MRWTALAAFLAGYLFLVQPGMCPYWLVADPALLGSASATHAQHDHAESQSLFQTTVTLGLPQVLVSAAAWLAVLAAAALRRPTNSPPVFPAEWRPPLWSPPPRCTAA